MKDFRSYSNEPKKDGGRPAGEDNAPENSQKTDSPQASKQVNNTVELAKILSRAMSGKSETQILRNILSEAERGKREGTLTNADLDNFYNALAPMLDGIKKRKLAEVIKQLKSI